MCVIKVIQVIINPVNHNIIVKQMCQQRSAATIFYNWLKNA